MQTDTRRMLKRYRQAVKAYAELSEKIESSIPGAGTGAKKQLQKALDDLLPILGECIAELPGVVADLTEKNDALRLLHRQAAAAGLKLRYRETPANWKLIATNIEPRLAEMTFLQPIHTGLQALIAEAEAMEAEQETIRGRLAVLSRLRTEISRRGEGLRSRVAAHLKGSFGFTSKELIQYGVNPLKTEGRARPVRRKNNAEPAGSSVEPPAPAPSTTP